MGTSKHLSWREWVNRSPWNKCSERDLILMLSRSLPSHTIPSGVQWPYTKSLHLKVIATPGNHRVCIRSHLLCTRKAGEVVTSSQVHCLVGANARIAWQSSPPSPHPWEVLDSAQRKGKNRGRTIVWEEQGDLLEALPLCLTDSFHWWAFTPKHLHTRSNLTESFVAGEFSECKLRFPNASSIK